MSQAIDDLLNEHEAIQAALVTLEAMGTATLNSHKLNTTDAADFLGFIREFADKCHHGKEELMLFPAMSAAGVQTQDGPIGVLLADHALGRKLVNDMGSAVASDNEAMFVNAGQEYSRLLRLHIAKENNVFFPMAERILSQQVLAELFEAFEAHEEKVIGHGRHEQLHAILERLHAKYVRE